MTPFAQLGNLEKSAGGYSSSDFARNMHGMMGGPAVPAVGNAATNVAQGGGWGSGAAELGADMALGWNPFTGVPWFGGKALRDFSKGNWGSGLMNIGMGALSFLPGGGSAGAAAKGALVGAKGLSRLGKIRQGISDGVGAAKGWAGSNIAKLPGGARALQGAQAMQTGGQLGSGTRKALGWGGGTAAGVGLGAEMFGVGGGAPQVQTPNYDAQPQVDPNFAHDFYGGQNNPYGAYNSPTW